MKTKYPILLVHGMAIKDIFFLKSFGQIDRILKSEGFIVYKSNVDSFGTTESNAKVLKREIDDITSKENIEKVNIIAHSKGGLDVIKMLRLYGNEDKIASFTTLCTPHKGSPIASNILRLPGWMLAITAFWINFWYKIFGDKNPDALNVCKELALIDSIEEETLKLSDRFYCQSFSTVLKRSRDDFIMGIPLMFSHYYDKSNESDGLVSPPSAMFGEYRGNCTEASVSHTEMIDFMVKKKKKEKIYAFYSSLCEELKNAGY